MEPKGPGKKVRQGKDTYQLPGYGYHQAVDAVAHGLEHGTYDDAVSGKQEAEADDAQGRDADGQHVRVRLEEHEQLRGHELEHGQSDEHDPHRDPNA